MGGCTYLCALSNSQTDFSVQQIGITSKDHCQFVFLINIPDLKYHVHKYRLYAHVSIHDGRLAAILEMQPYAAYIEKVSNF